MEDTRTKIIVNQQIQDVSHRTITIFGRPNDLVRAVEEINKTEERIGQQSKDKHTEIRAKVLPLKSSYVMVSL